MNFTATYSPEDNKLRLYAIARLPAELYKRVCAAGFIWAPKQGLFVAPMWTPEREDLLLELAGEIGDEDTSLVERAEERAERFEEYGDKRAEDATRAHAQVEQIIDGIPLGQPILVGHHSEKHARRDAEKIEAGMRKAVRMWETSKYWVARAAGAIRHAKFKEQPAVRAARRIKGLEADRRKMEKACVEHERLLRFWSRAGIAKEEAIKVANYFDRLGVKLAEGQRDWSAWSALTDGRITVDEVKRQRAEGLPPIIARYARWVAHIDNRLTYERAMMGESGGIATDKVKPEKGGACRCWASPGHGRGWSIIQKVNKVSVTVLDNWGNGGKNFTRTIPFDQLKGIMSKAEVDAKRTAELLVVSDNGLGFYLLDAPPPEPRPVREPEAPTVFDAMKDTLRAGGVKVVSVPNLFPTPADLARRVVELAEIGPGMTVLEPSAGTGSLIDVMPDTPIVAVEINSQLAEALQRRFTGVVVHHADFLALNGELGTFDRIVMNPPFDHGSDIDHIRHAFAKLNPGGRLVAICASGPRQREELGEICTQWIDLPAGSFKEQGTSVSTAIVVIDG